VSMAGIDQNLTFVHKVLTGCSPAAGTNHFGHFVLTRELLPSMHKLVGPLPTPAYFLSPPFSPTNPARTSHDAQWQASATCMGFSGRRN
jgi:hypothetical protein